jgi:glycosyltransferase involved in cell wall biosynthesis
MAQAERPLRILQILRSPVGGLFRHVTDLTCALIERGHEVGIVADSLTGGERANQVFAALEPILSLGLTRLPISRYPSFSDLRNIKKIRRLALEKNVEILHGHGAKGGAYARKIAHKIYKRAFYTPHGGSLHYHWRSLSGAAFLSMEKVLVGRQDSLIFESQYSQRVFEEKIGRPACSSKVIENGLTPEEFQLLNFEQPKDYDLVFIGELRYLKGVDIFLLALPDMINEHGQPARTLIVGDGPDAQTYRDMVLELDLASRVTFHPPMEARDAFEKADVMVMPSRAESFPYIILEAAACGLPIVATRVGGIPEIFGPHAQDLVRADDPENLVHAVNTKLSDLSGARDKALALREFVQNQFSLTHMVDRIEAYYRQSL